MLAVIITATLEFGVYEPNSVTYIFYFKHLVWGAVSKVGFVLLMNILCRTEAELLTFGLDVGILTENYLIKKNAASLTYSLQ
jgi:hypothetical protein